MEEELPVVSAVGAVAAEIQIFHRIRQAFHPGLFQHVRLRNDGRVRVVVRLKFERGVPLQLRFPFHQGRDAALVERLSQGADQGVVHVLELLAVRQRSVHLKLGNDLLVIDIGKQFLDQGGDIGVGLVLRHVFADQREDVLDELHHVGTGPLHERLLAAVSSHGPVEPRHDRVRVLAVFLEVRQQRPQRDLEVTPALESGRIDSKRLQQQVLEEQGHEIDPGELMRIRQPERAGGLAQDVVVSEERQRVPDGELVGRYQVLFVVSL